MALSFSEALENWAAGVITSLEADALPASASPRSYNSVLISAGADRASFGSRKGSRTLNTTPITGSPVVLGMAEFKRTVGSSVQLYHLIVSDNGRLDLLNVDETTSAADAVTPTQFTSGTKYPSFAMANNLAFIANGSDQRKFDGTTGSKWGLAKPSAAPTLSDGGAAGLMPAATYEALITYYNANTGTESSAGPTSTGLTQLVNHKLTVNWAASADAQVTHVNVYIHRTDTQPYFYQAAQIAVGTTTTTLNVDPKDLTVAAPTTTSNDPPPTNTTHCCWHNQRMFVTDGTNLYWSARGKPEQFDLVNDTEPLRPSYRVTALFSFGGMLIIGCQVGLFAISGTEPESWALEEIDPVVGVSAARTVTIVDGVARWWTRQGPVAMTENGPPKLIGLPLIRPTISADNLQYDQFSAACAAVDLQNERVLFAVAGLNATRNTLLLPYNYRLNVWESDRWEAIDVAALATVEDTVAVPRVFQGTYSGQVLKWWDALNDGIAAGTTKTGTVTSATSTTVTKTGAGWTVNALIDRYVMVIDPAQTRIQRRRITANTATTLTVSTAWDTTPTSDWTFVLGGIDFQFDTAVTHAGRPFDRKRLKFLHLIVGSSASGTTMDVNVFLNGAVDPSITYAGQAVGSATAQFDTALWDSGMWAGANVKLLRLRMAAKARNWRVRIRNYLPDVDVVIHRVLMTGVVLNDKNAG